MGESIQRRSDLARIISIGLGWLAADLVKVAPVWRYWKPLEQRTPHSAQTRPDAKSGSQSRGESKESWIPCFNSQTRKAAIRSLRNRIMESPWVVGQLESIVAGNWRVRRRACDRFRRSGRRGGTTTTVRFSSRTSNRSGLETLRGIFPRVRRYFLSCEALARIDT